MKNNFKTFFLMTVLTVFFVFVGGLLGGKEGAIIAFIFAAGTNFFAYWFSAKMVLKRYRAQEVTSSENRLYRVVQELIPKSGLPMLKVYVIPQESPKSNPATSSKTEPSPS